MSHFIDGLILVVILFVLLGVSLVCQGNQLVSLCLIPVAMIWLVDALMFITG